MNAKLTFHFGYIYLYKSDSFATESLFSELRVPNSFPKSAKLNFNPQKSCPTFVTMGPIFVTITNTLVIVTNIGQGVTIMSTELLLSSQILDLFSHKYWAKPCLSSQILGETAFVFSESVTYDTLACRTCQFTKAASYCKVYRSLG